MEAGKDIMSDFKLFIMIYASTALFSITSFIPDFNIIIRVGFLIVGIASMVVAFRRIRNDRAHKA